MEIAIKIAQLLLSLSILVVFHELGHFVAARIFGIRVEKFYIFFDPWFSLFKFKRGHTEYGVGWLPLGGYVKIAGMIDESMDTETMKQPPQPYEFRTKPAWQRLIVMLAGVTVNLILAGLIYVGILSFWGEQYLLNSEVKYGITVDSLGYRMGLRNGDKIISLDGKTVNEFADIPRKMILDEVKVITVERDNERVDVVLPPWAINQLIKQKTPGFLSVRIPFVAASFTTSSPAKAAGIAANDHIIGINDTLYAYFDQFRGAIQHYKNKSVGIMVERGGDTLRMMVNVPAEGLIGIYPKSPIDFLTFSERDYSLFSAIPAGFVRAYEGAGNYLKSIKLLFSQEKAYESVGGFISIGNIFPGLWDWESFWSLTAFLSIMLAILNVLPIPALDGGHVMFLLYEIIARKKPSDKFMEYAQIVGMVLLFGLLIFANANDIIKLFR
ncbi:MAG TPA: RIP metalloprotease RseP [Bacteroidales bacterium]|nr:RIP metalloprotease RseP [Bacteroidales bacterium]HPS73479.1 RIP metalloprotease RseP [Bacteroidales bacterium]